jgi:hypothetical protein
VPHLRRQFFIVTAVRTSDHTKGFVLNMKLEELLFCGRLIDIFTTKGSENVLFSFAALECNTQ